MSERLARLHQLIDKVNQQAHELAQDGYRVEVDAQEIREMGYHPYPLLAVSVLKPVVPEPGGRGS